MSAAPKKIKMNRYQLQNMAEMLKALDEAGEFPTATYDYTGEGEIYKITYDRDSLRHEITVSI